MIRLNYLLINPVKHRVADNLHDYQFASCHHLWAEMGRSRLVEQIERYPDYKQLILHEAHNDDF